MSTEQMKGQDPDILDLYDVHVKKEPDSNLIGPSDSYSSNIAQNDSVVKPLKQRTQANGYYDAELKVIVLGRNMNTMTLHHEIIEIGLAATQNQSAAQTSPITTISLGVLRQKVKPARYKDGTLYQRTQANGYYDAELKVIVLGRNMNTMTLHREILDFYLRFCRLLILRLVRLASLYALVAELKLICASMINNIPKYAGATQESSAVFCDAAW